MEILDCLHSNGKPNSYINAALPPRGLLHVKEQNINHSVTRTLGGLTSFAVICYQSICELLCVCSISSDMSDNRGKNRWQQLCVLRRHATRVAAAVWYVLENTVIIEVDEAKGAGETDGEKVKCVAKDQSAGSGRTASSQTLCATRSKIFGCCNVQLMGLGWWYTWFRWPGMPCEIYYEITCLLRCL